MSWPLRYLAIGACGFVAIGCSEKADGPPSGPNFHTVLSKASGCDVGHIGQLANFYFSPPRKQQVKTFVDLLATQVPYSVDAKNSGFNIMAEIEGAVSDATSGDPATGSDLINHLLLCMYNPTAEAASYPASFPDTFTVALNPSSTGAFAHRTSGTSTAVYARTLSATLAHGFSGIAPVGNWGVVVPNTTPPPFPPRVVFYGRPATTGTSIDPGTYDWRTIPHNASFNPEIVIAVCEESSGNTLMLNEQGVAILSFVDAGFLDPNAGGVNSCSTTNTALLDGNRPFDLARRLVRFGTGFFTPGPLMAAALSPGGVGGRSSKCCSKVGVEDVPSVSVSLSPVTTPLKVNTLFSLTVTTKSDNDLVNGSRVTLTTATNNGTGTFIRQVTPGQSCSQGMVPQVITGTDGSAPGTYEFKNNLCITSTGNVFIAATALAQRGDIPSTATSNKINVKP